MSKAAPRFSSNYRIMVPEEEDALPVPLSFWKLIMTRIEKAGKSSSRLDSFAWACFSFGGSSLLGAIGLVVNVDFSQLSAIITEAILCVFVIAGFGIGAVTLYYARLHREDQSDLQEIIVEDMRLFADKHRPRCES